MKRKYMTLLFLVALGGSTAAAGVGEVRAAVGPIDKLSLERAFEMAERLHPALAEARAKVEAAEGRAVQAGTFPNPEAILGAQQIPFDKETSNQREFVAGLAQPIPLGGRLGKARMAELFEREVRARGLELVRRDLRKTVQESFAAALYQERALEVQAETVRNSEALVTMTRARVAAGDALAADLARAEMELTRTSLEVQRGRSLAEQAMIKLAASIGDARLRIRSLAGDLDSAPDMPSLVSLAANLPAHPEMLQAVAGVRASHARVDLVNAERIPDVRVEALYHRLDATKEDTFDLGLSFPLPLFDRNRGRAKEAMAEAAAAEARSSVAANDLNLRLRESYARLDTALSSARAFETELLPRADAVLKSAESRYAAGDAGMTEVLLIRREWAEVRLGHLASLRDVMQARAELSVYLQRR